MDTAMSAKKETDKADTKASKRNSNRVDLDKVLLKTVQLVVRHPPHQLTYSKISRLIGTPRSTLYYYFGKNVWSLIEEAARFGMKKYALIEKETDFKKYKNWKEFQNYRLNKALDMVEKNPWAPRLYFRFRDDPSSIGQIIRRTETEYLNEMRVIWCHFHGGQKPRSENEKIATALKLGFLWGYAVEIAQSKGPNFDRKKIVKKISVLLETLLEE